MILQNITFPNQDHLGVSSRKLYILSNYDYIINEDTIYSSKGAVLSFNTYFNSISIKKWNRYCNVQKIKFKASIKGIGELQLKAQTLMGAEIVVKSIYIDSKDSYQDIELDIEDISLLSIAYIEFFLVENHISIKNSYFIRNDNFNINKNITLSAVVTTFNRKPYIEKLLEIIQHDKIKALNINFYIVDNASNINIKSSENYKIIKNKNYGGAGGFTRGIIECLKSNTTHVLLMDDDIYLHLESILRLYYFISNISEDYKSSIISGAMLDKFNPCFQNERNAAIYSDGYLYFGQDIDLSDNSLLLEEINSLEIESGGIAAWWFSCIPTKLIIKKELPYNIFIRGDDIEFSLRLNSKIISLNGICVWHDPFYLKFSEVMDEYYLVRNMLLIAIKYPHLYSKIVKRYFLKNLRYNLLNMDYASAKLNVLAYRHILRGNFLDSDASKLHNIVSKIYKYYSKNNISYVDNSEFDQLITNKKTSLKKRWLKILLGKKVKKKIAYSYFGYSRLPRNIIGYKMLISKNPFTNIIKCYTFDKKELKKLTLTYCLLKIKLTKKIFYKKFIKKANKKIYNHKSSQYWCKLFDEQELYKELKK